MKVLDGPRHAGDPLTQMYRVPDIKQLYQKDLFLSPPWMLTPSSVKILYEIVTNYQRNYWGKDPLGKGLKKTPLAVVDLCETPKQRAELKNRYLFVDWSKATLYAAGFNQESLETIFTTG